MTGSGRDRRAALVAPALAAALLVLVWAAATGPGQLLTPSPRARAIPTELTAVATPSETETSRSLIANLQQHRDLSPKTAESLDDAFEVLRSADASLMLIIGRSLTARPTMTGPVPAAFF